MPVTSLFIAALSAIAGVGCMVWDANGLAQLVGEGQLTRDQLAAAAGLVLAGFGVGFGVVAYMTA